MNDIAATPDFGADERGEALATLFKFHELWLAERMPDGGRDAVFWQGEKIPYDALKEGLAGQRKYFVSPSPYPGLRSFTPQEGRVFFGRRSDVEEVRDRLKAHRMVMVLGGSGSGKSSLVRAGVLPHLNGVGRIGGRGGTWYWCEFRPEQSPMVNLLTALAKHVVAPLVEAIGVRAEDDPTIADRLAASGLSLEATPDAVLDWVRAPFDAATDPRALFDVLWDFVDRRLDGLDDLATGGIRAGKPNVLILLDQFEEVFREGVTEDQRKQTTDLLCLLAQMDEKLRGAPWSEGGLFMALTMRSEELHRCGEHDGLTDIVNRSVFLLELLDPERDNDRRVLHRAIVEPTRRVFISYDLPFDRDDNDSPFAPGVPDWLIEGSSKQWAGLEHRPDQLPLLQHALRSMWDAAVVRWKADPQTAYPPRLEKADLPGDDLATEYPDLDLCLSNRADAAAEEARGRFRDEVGDEAPRRLSAKDCPEGEVALRAAFSALARQDDRGNRARRFATLEEMIPFLENDAAARGLGPLGPRLERALAPLIFHGYLTGGGGRPYDISHEALIRNWDRCTRWLGQNEEVVRALRRFLDDIDPAVFRKLKDKDKIAESVSRGFQEQISLIGKNQPVPESWAKDQIELLLRASPDRRRVWIGERRTYGTATADEVAAVLRRVQLIAAKARDARIALREERTLANERAKQVPILEENERRARQSEADAREAEAKAQQAADEAREAEKKARQSAAEARTAQAKAQQSADEALAAKAEVMSSEGKAQRSAKIARGRMNLAFGGCLLAAFAGAMAYINLGITQRVLATSQIESTGASNWSQATKLGILKEARPLPYVFLLFGQTRTKAIQEAERWDRVARSLIGENFWIPSGAVAGSVTAPSCWTRNGGAWRARSPATTTALQDFASSTQTLSVAGAGPNLLLKVGSRHGGAPQQVDLGNQAALPPLGDGSEVCLSTNGAILTAAFPGNAVPSIFELNLLNCHEQCVASLNEIDPSLTPNRRAPARDKGSLEVVDLQVAPHPQRATIASVQAIDVLAKRDDRVAVRFASDYFTGSETSYVATFHGGWATAKRVGTPSQSVRTTCKDEGLDRQNQSKWRCPDTRSRLGGDLVVRLREPMAALNRAPAEPQRQARLVSATIEIKRPSLGARLRTITVAVPPDSTPLGRGPSDTFLLKDRVGDLWSVKISESALERRVMRLGDGSYLPETVIAAAPSLKRMQTPALLTKRGDQ